MPWRSRNTRRRSTVDRHTDEILLVVRSVAFLVGVLELVEGGVLRVEQLAVPPEESLVEVTCFAHPRLLLSGAGVVRAPGR